MAYQLSLKDEILLLELKHKHRMKELEYIRYTEKLKHSMNLERNRIMNAEIRKREERRENGKY